MTDTLSALIDDRPIVLAGAGKMGAALLAGWLQGGVKAAQIIVQDPTPSTDIAALARHHAIRLEPSLASLADAPSVIVVAVKPQAMDAAFPPLARLAGSSTVILSIAAGKSIVSFERHLAATCAVVRAMPNTPASIGRGITGAVANAHTTNAQRNLCHALLSAVGDVIWLADETLIDAVTAVSGSGPAYVFWLTETMAEAGRRAGLDAATAMRLARATVSGAGEMMARSADAASVLRQNVTSPGGTTAAALAVLMREPDGLQDLMSDAIAAAQKRSQQLGS